MAVPLVTQWMDEITDFLATSPSHEDLIAFRLSDALSQRALSLLRKQKEEELSAQEQVELADYIRMDHFMTLLKAKARLNLSLTYG